MKTRFALPLSALVHGALVVVLSVMSFDPVQLSPPPPGMELEIIDFEHAMPLPDPTVAKDFSPAPAPAPAPAQQDLVAIPVPASMPQVVTRVQQARPALQPSSPVAPAAKAVTPPVLQLGPGPVSMLQDPPHPAPRPSAAPVAARFAPSAAPRLETTPAPAPAQVRSKIDAGALSRMLATKSAANAQTRLHSAEIGSAIGRAAPRGAASLTARQRINLEEMIRSQIVRCWNPPVNEDAAESNVTVLMHIRLDRAGALAGLPEVIALKGANSGNAAYARAFAASVRRAISRCSPLRLPPELFDAWSDIELNFDPKDVT